jgi:hypothetical protein
MGNKKLNMKPQKVRCREQKEKKIETAVLASQHAPTASTRVSLMRGTRQERQREHKKVTKGAKKETRVTKKSAHMTDSNI